MLCVYGNANAQVMGGTTSGVSQIKLLNGLNVIHRTQAANAATVRIDLVVRLGSVYEADTNHGASEAIRLMAEAKLRSGIAKTASLSGKVQMFSGITSEQTWYSFQAPSDRMNDLLVLVRDSVFQHTYTLNEAQQAVEQLLAHVKQVNETPAGKFYDKILQHTYRADAFKLAANGSSLSNTLKPGSVLSLKAKYYVMSNCILAIQSNYNVPQIAELSNHVFRQLPKTPFDPESVTKIIDFKPMVYSTRFYQFTDIGQPEIHLVWQLQGANNNREDSYRSFLLATLINDPNNYIHVKAAKLGCKSIQATYVNHNFSGYLKVVVKPSIEQFSQTYEWVYNELLNLHATLVNETMLNAAKLQFRNAYQQSVTSPEFLMNIIKYWPHNDMSYYFNLSDSVMVVTEKQMSKFAKEYITEAPALTGIIMSESQYQQAGMDSLLPVMDESVNDYVFMFRQNLADIEGEQNLNQLKRLVKWLKFNPDVLIQVNGFSDEMEFGKIYDAEISRFIDSLPSFRKANPEKSKSGYYRPDFLRTMRIVKYLYDNGIDPERISGTSMMFTSSNRQEALNNMKCTVTLTKQRRSLTLRQYHSGTH